MKIVLSFQLINEKPYNKFNAFSRMLDKLKIKVEGRSIIEPLNVEIHHIKIPFNLSYDAYIYNVNTIIRKYKDIYPVVSIKGNRIYDINLITKFQRKLLAYGVIVSIKAILLKSGKSLKNSIILVDDAVDPISQECIEELAKNTKHIILYSKNIRATNKLREYLIANYGVSPEIIWDENCFKLADFVISSKKREYECARIWYLDNFYRPENWDKVLVNDITYEIPWNFKEKEMSAELLGAVIDNNKKVDIEKVLKYNGITIEKIKFNDKVVIL
ncbi:hypothetical protein CPJCM30710_28350 [Clostridium polyendosporum]|uniref:Uncharacterized protein n=1 Tax=Clostridium polyendosporum TaxID=69208 RepID=A0A919S2B7_9CLOT|nr:hypothetical protein [Clostridium polyendosporum]GIM30169.1 hypothetical protein CPJCM30710_28350 [Clostridium polyendosporum]